VLRRHRVAITRAGGVMLVAIGGLLVTGWWAGIVGALQGTVTDFVPVV
jgi:cytochrome c-type biogenesis protein